MQITNSFARLVALMVAMILLSAAMQGMNAQLVTEVTPLGIISLQFAGDLSRAQAMLHAWDPAQEVLGGVSLGFDYLYLVVYAGAIASTCLYLAAGLPERWQRLAPVGQLAARAAGIAAVLDAVENYALIRLLLAQLDPLWPSLARWCAAFKFALLGLALFYLPLAIAARLHERRSTQEGRGSLTE